MPGIRRLASSLLLTLLLFAPRISPAAPLFTRVPALPGRAQPLAARPGTSLMSLDAGALADFRAARGGALSVPRPDGGSFDLTLEPFDVGLAGARIVARDETGEHPIAVDLSLFKGHVAGDPASWAVIGLSPRGAMGTIVAGGERWQLLPTAAGGDGALPLHALANASSLDAPASAATFACGDDDEHLGALAPLGLAAPLAPAGRIATPEQATLDATRKSFAVAIDCDFDLYSGKFGGDLTACTNYVLTVLGTVSLIYERDLEATLTYPYVRVWTTAADPYTQATTGGELPEFQNYWNANMGSVTRSVAHLISGRPLGGGIAYLGVLCNTGSGYGVSAIDAAYAYPNGAATWDVNVIAHEIGHNFGSYHTHSCNWATQGYVPAHTLLDTCQASEGGCFTGANTVPPDKGTIMSYCHLLTGGMNNIRLDFHPVCITRMRQFIDAAGCAGTPAVAPPRHPLASSTATGVHLAWTASSSSGVLRYDVYRSRLPFDLNPVKLGSTSGLSFDDVGLGNQYYKVRAVRAADSSSFGAEMKLNLCAFTSPGLASVGSQPGTIASGDLNGDGITDLVVGNGGGGTVTVLLGNGAAGTGDGTFTPGQVLDTGFGPACLALGDVDGDGIADVVVGTTSDISVWVHHGNGTGGVGNGTFAPGVPYVVNVAPAGIALADLDEDGAPDVLVAGGFAGLMRLHGHLVNDVPDGTFTGPDTLAIGGPSRGVIVADLNLDGIPDVATSMGSQVKVLFGGGTAGKADGTYPTIVTLNAGGGAADLASGDLNLDGIPDLLVCNSSASSVTAYLGNGTGGVPSGTYPLNGASVATGSNPRGVQIGDWSGDGVPDLAVTNNNTTNRSVSVVTGKGDGTFNTAIAYPVGNSPYALAMADFNHDGGIDLAAVNRGANTVTSLLSGCTNAVSIALSLGAPVGGETWIATEERPITWTRGAGVVMVDVQLSRDGGATWQTLARNVTGTHWTWSVAGAGTTHARVRVIDSARPQVVATSPADFTIVPASQLAVAPGRTAPFGVLGAWPNPSRGAVTVALSLPAGGAGATLDWVDLAGRRVASRQLGALGAGTHGIALSAGRALAPGMYLLRLSRSGETSTRKLAVLR